MISQWVTHLSGGIFHITIHVELSIHVSKIFKKLRSERFEKIFE